MFKKKIFYLVLLSQSLFLFAQNNSSKIKFLKGNIVEKTAAVREASGNDAIWLSNEAIKFSLENKELLGNDRELDGLAVAAILSISPDYVKYATETQKKLLTAQFIQLFSKYTSSSTVQIAVLTKTLALKDFLPIKDFADVLNNYLSSVNVKNTDSSVFKASLSAIEFLGNNESFTILYKMLYNPKYTDYYTEIEKAVISLIPNAMNEVLSIIHNADMAQMAKLFKLIIEKSNISKNFLCEISENVLSESILLVESSSKNSTDDISLQLSALKILSENKWTRASSIALSYFQFSKKQFDNGTMNAEQFNEVIIALSSISPIDAVTPLTGYLEELNSATEKGTKVSSEIVLAVIKALGAIGDKSAFDSLLAVTYLDYPESVLSAAREALSGLRW